MGLFPARYQGVLASDNAAIIDFLATTASVFNQKGYLSIKDTDNLRIALSSLQSDEEQRSRPFLAQFVAQDWEYLHILLSRYGASRLGSNLLRYTARSELQKLVTSLSTWGENLIALAKRCFNRPFPLFEEDGYEGRILYASVITHYAEVVAKACQQLQEAESLCGAYFPHAMASNSDNDWEVDKAMAEALGFHSLCWEPFPSLSDHRIAKLVAAAVRSLLENVTAICQHMPLKGHLQGVTAFHILCDGLSLEVEALLHIQFARKSDLVASDLRRQVFLYSLQKIRNDFSTLAVAFEDLVREHQTVIAARVGFRPSREVERKITSDLIAFGAGAKSAGHATQDLMAYMEAHALKPKEVLLAELNKINHLLTPRSLELLQEFYQDEALAKVAVSEKKRVFAQVQALAEYFQKHLKDLNKAAVTLLIFASLPLLGCGLKMAPKSDELDYRPEIPFHAGEDEGAQEVYKMGGALQQLVPTKKRQN